MRRIIIDRLCKAFGEKIVLQDFSCSFDAGSITCLMAPSGWGKTTLLRLMIGLEQADSGSITGTEDARICVLFQEDRLCENLDAAANLMLVNSELTRKDAVFALQMAGLTDCRQPVREFSGGMKRRTALMRALCMPGDLLLLDEPFKGLDADTRMRMLDCIGKYRHGRTLILVSHDENDARDLQARVIHMDQV